MAVRHFEYNEAKNTMSKVQSEAKSVEKYLARCEEIVNENVGVENRWSGARANAFKEKWEKTSSEFKDFVALINQYATKIDESYQAHKSYEDRGI